jgi:site-specific recombinase XerD
VDLPYVFLSFKTPYNPLAKNAVANTITEWMHNAGVDFATRRHGSHILRHSLATSLLSNEVTLPVISETLGHSNSQVTTAYLRVSVDLLRQCALDVPFIPTTIYDNLYGESK